MVAWKNQREQYRGQGKVYLVRFLDDPGPIELPLSPARSTRLRREPHEALDACKQ